MSQKITSSFMNGQKKSLLILPLFLVLISVSACMGGASSSTEVQPVMSAGTKELPSADMFKAAVSEAYARFKGLNEGKNADYIPYLAKVNPNLFSVAIVTVKGDVYTAGDADHAFPIESVAKPFVLSLAMQQSGLDAIVDKIGVEPTGMPFNSVLAVENLQMKNNHPAGNPLVNAGAMTTVSLLKAKDKEDRWNQILNYLSDYAGEKLTLNQEVYESEASSNQHNKGIAELLYSYGKFYADPAEAVDVYTKECSINVTAKELAVMGATLANNGMNPITHKTLLDPKSVPKLLAVMMMAGFYDEAGLWAWDAGVPAKTGVGGGIVAVVPGKYAVVGFSPRLDVAGNSIKATKAIDYIINKLNANLFVS